MTSKIISQRLIFIVLLFFSLYVSASADTLRIMHYNLLYYGYDTNFCNQQNNNIADKEKNLRTIIAHFQPHILTVNELGRGEANLQNVRDNVLNLISEQSYEFASYTNLAGSNIVNGLFYNTSKFGISRQAIPNTLLRDINLVTFFYRSPDLPITRDTIFLTCIVGHLKAGQTSSDQQTRTTMVSNVMQYLNEHLTDHNILIMGDFNMRSSHEQAYQLMVNHPNPGIRLYDPVDAPGVWNNNSAMAFLHTQSTRTGSHPCFVTGGLDDRFDFILINNAVLSGSKGFKYLENSYKTAGQDGLRFDQSLISPPNLSEPPEVIMAMYNFSDHLPVMMELVVNSKNAIISESTTPSFQIRAKNPVYATLEVLISTELQADLQIRIFNMAGNMVMTSTLNAEGINSWYKKDVSALAPGFYTITICPEHFRCQSFKMIKY